MKHVVPALRAYLLMTVLLGLAYPLLVTGVGRLFFKYQAAGSLITRDGVVIGSELIAQNFVGPRYFWPRPSANGYDALASGGSNLGPISAVLKDAVRTREAAGGSSVPLSLAFASASGLDPHLDPEGLEFQIERVARARAVSPAWLRDKIKGLVQSRDLGFLGWPRVNVLELNLSLDP